MNVNTILIKDEIDLIDYAKLFIKYRFVCLGIFLTCIIVFLAITAFERKNYQTTTIMQMAKLPSLSFSLEPVLTANDASNLILSSEFLKEVKNKISLNNVILDVLRKDISLAEERGEVLILHVKNENKESAVKIDSAISTIFQEKASQIYSRKSQILTESLQKINAERIIAEQAIAEINPSISKFKNSKDFLKVSNIFSLNLAQCKELLKQEEYIKNQLLLPKNLEIIHKPITQTIKNKLSTIAFGTVLGFILSLCFVSLSEFWKNNIHG